jgi:hypothetical protein
VSGAIAGKDIKHANEVVGLETNHCFHGFQHGILGMSAAPNDNPMAYKKGQEMRPKLLDSVRQKHPKATEEEISAALFKSPKLNQLEEHVYHQILAKVRQAVWADYVKNRKNEWAKCQTADRDQIWKAIWGTLPEPRDPRYLNCTT